MTTSFRSDVRTWLKAALDSVVSSGELKTAYDVEPPEFRNAYPAGWIESLPEDVEHGAGVRTRTMGPTLVIRDLLTNNNATAKRLDTAVDATVDALTASPSVASGADRGSWRIEDIPPTAGDSARDVRITLLSVDLAEPRL